MNLLLLCRIFYAEGGSPGDVNNKSDEVPQAYYEEIIEENDDSITISTEDYSPPPKPTKSISINGVVYDFVTAEEYVSDNSPSKKAKSKSQLKDEDRGYRTKWRNGRPSYWKDGKYICEYCQKDCGYMNNLKMHIKRTHGIYKSADSIRSTLDEIANQATVGVVREANMSYSVGPNR